MGSLFVWSFNIAHNSLIGLIKLHKYNTKPATLGIKVAGYFLTALDMI
jgi:hypothetical protein